MPRHPDNTNLHLHREDTFEGLPVMVEKGPFVRQYLSRLKRTIDLALSQYSRVLAFRVDLRLPLGVDLPEYAYTNEGRSRFVALALHCQTPLGTSLSTVSWHLITWIMITVTRCIAGLDASSHCLSMIVNIPCKH